MKLQLTREQHAEIMEYVKQCPDEIGGLGTVFFDDNGTAHVEHLFMVKQEVHGTTCELDPADINRVMFEAFEKNAEGQLCFWWHSHVHMGVSPSGQDDKTMAQIGNAGFAVAMIINKRGEMSCRYYQKHPKLAVNIDVEVSSPSNKALEDEVKANIEKYVSRFQYKHANTAFSGRGWDAYFYDHIGPDDGYDYRRTLHPPTTKETEKTVQEKPKSNGEVSPKATIVKGVGAVRAFYEEEFHRRCEEDTMFANDLFKDYSYEKGTNPTDMDQIKDWYVNRQMNRKL